MRKKYVVMQLMWFLVLGASGQNVQDIVINGRLCCTLHEALQTLESKYDVDFQYDEESLDLIEYRSMQINKPLLTYIIEICRSYDLNYKMDFGSNVIQIIQKPKKPEELAKVKEQQRMMAQEKKSYFGAPSRFDFNLSGRVLDYKTREPLPFVTVMTKGSTNGTTSNIDGFFTLFNVPSDTSTIVLNYMGYHAKELFLDPDKARNNVFVEMLPQSIGLKELVVKADRKEVLQVNREQASVLKMSPQQLSALPNLGEKDILRSFQLMPGISAANENSSGLYVRGGTPDQVLVLYDGFTVYNVEHMFGFFSAFNSNTIKDVQLYKGGFDAQYGGRLSSVVEIVGKEGNQKAFNASADVSLMSVNALVEFPIGKKASAVFAGRRSWKSPIYNKIYDQFVDDAEASGPGAGMGRPGGTGASTDQQTISYFYDLNGKLTFRPSDKDNLALSVYNGKDNLDNSVSPSSGGFGGGMTMDMETTDLTNWGNTGASLKWSRKHNQALYSNALLSFSNYYSVRERATSGTFSRDGESGSVNNNLNEDNNLIDLTAKIDFEYELSQHQKWGFGLQAVHNDIDYSYVQDDTVSVINRDSEGELYSAYIQDKLSLLSGNKLTFTPGLRYTFFTGTDKSYYEPRLNTVYKWNDQWRLKGATGLYYQFAKRVMREDISEGSRDFWVLSDDDHLPVSSSLQFILGAAYETPNYLFDVEGYYKQLDNVTEYSLRVESRREAIAYEENFFTGTGVAKGLDFLLQKKTGVITGWVAYTLAQVTNHIEEFGDYDFYASHDVTHEFKTVLTYRWRNWDFGATWLYATGRPYTSPEGGYELSLLDGSTQDYINVSVKNGQRLPNYHRCDLSANYNFKIGANNSPASIGFSVFNAYNRANVWYKEYEVLDNEVLETPVYYLGFTPNVTLSIHLK